MSPKKLILEQESVNGNLREMMKKSDVSKNLVEYKATQLVRSQDRIRQTTLSGRFKQFSKLARDIEATKDSHVKT